MLPALWLTGCAGPPQPLAGGDPQACINTCNDVGKRCLGSGASCPVRGQHNCKGLADASQRLACMSEEGECGVSREERCLTLRANCVQSCGL
ncbi:MAG TPA: hypothetical protein VD865_06560 [Stenotrophomonas sp.]|nr:hypothetical protein [Stenotrophomonas sp.]